MCDQKKKKLIFVSEALWIGGIETALVNLLNRLDYEKYDVTCLVVRGSLELAERITPRCRLIVADRERTVTFDVPYRYRRLYHLTEEPENPSALHSALMWTVPAIRWLENRLYIRYIRSRMQGEHFDTCIIYSDRTAEIAVRGIRAERYLMFYHHGAMRRVYHDEIGYRKSERIVTVSDTASEKLKRFCPAYADKITAIHNLVDWSAVIQKSGEAPGQLFPAEGVHLVSCGRLTEAKGYDWAIRAMQILLRNGYHNLQWWIVGGGPEETALREQIKAAGVEEQFHLLGMQENPYPYIAGADLYVQPSRYENYSVVILEAMALCRPILATIPAAQEQIQSGVNGLLCQPNPEGIAAGIEYLYLHPEETQRYINALRENPLEQENEKIMEKLYALFDGI